MKRRRRRKDRLNASYIYLLLELLFTYRLFTICTYYSISLDLLCTCRLFNGCTYISQLLDLFVLLDFLLYVLSILYFQAFHICYSLLFSHFFCISILLELVFTILDFLQSVFTFVFLLAFYICFFLGFVTFVFP